MRPVEAIAALIERNGQIWAENGELCLRVPKGALDDTLRAALKDSKEELLVLLGEKRRHAPLSFAQQRLWFLGQLSGPGNTYNMQMAFRLEGPSPAAHLAGAIALMVERHAVFRTGFSSLAGVPAQVIEPSILVPMEMDETSATDLDVARREADAWAIALAERPFDFTAPPLLRAGLFKTAREEHLFVLCAHHIVCDGWSLRIMGEEVFGACQARIRGEKHALPELTLQYADAAVQQRRRLAEELDGLMNYWRDTLAGELPLLASPADYPYPPILTTRGASLNRLSPRPLLDAFAALCRTRGMTLYMGLLAAFGVLLRRYSGQDDIIIGSPIAGRRAQGTENLAGFFANTLALRLDLSGNPSFDDLLVRVRKTSLDAQQHDEIPFEKLVEVLQPERNMARPPIFQVMFALQDIYRPSLDLDGLRVTREPLDIERSKLELNFSVSQHPEGLLAIAEYNTDIFREDTIARMLRHYEVLLESIIAAPEAPILGLSILPEEERRLIVETWNATASEYPRNRCVHELFSEQAAMNPAAPALRDSSRTMTYAEVDAASDRIASRLRAMGAKPGDIVVLAADRAMDTVLAILGILKSGAAYLPLDRANPDARLRFMLDDAKPILILHDATAENLLADYPTERLSIASALEPTRPHEARPLPFAKHGDLAYVMYTSGSTGAPKGVCVRHDNIIRLVKNTNYIEFRSDDVFMLFAPLSFDATTFELWAPLLNGYELTIFPPHLPDLEELGRFIRDNGVTTIFLTAGLFHQMVDSQLHNLTGLRVLLSGGDVLSPDHVRRTLEGLPGCTVVNCYGPTECTCFACCNPLTSPEQVVSPLPIGRPLANDRLYVLDEQLSPVPIGAPGELYIGGDGVARGYLNQPALTADRFIPDTFSGDPFARLYRTGDRARYLADGAIEFLGRLDFQVKLRGFRIELGDIETALTSHPGVAQALVILRRDAAGDARLAAYYVPQPGDDGPAPAALKAHVESQVPSYMAPAAYVRLAVIPLTTNGKVNRAALPAPDVDDLATTTAFTAPRDDIELRLTHIWEDLFDIRPIGVHQSFFELGGHSFLAVRMMAILREVFGAELPLPALFQNPSIAGLAVAIRESKTGGAGFLVPLLAVIQPKGDKPPMFCVHPAPGTVFCFQKLAACLGNDRPFYGIQAPGLYDDATPIDTIQGMASAYLEEVRRVQPHGPYHLAGHSGGGLVAFEMGHMLREAGEEVGLLVLLDPPAPVSNAASAAYSYRMIGEVEESVLALGLAVMGAILQDKPINLKFKEITRLDPEARAKAIFDVFVSSDFAPPGSDYSYVRRMVAVTRANLRARWSYQAPPLDMPALLLVPHEDFNMIPEGAMSTVVMTGIRFIFRHPIFCLPKLPRLASSLVRLFWNMRLSDRGWKPYLQGESRVQPVPGDHISMLRSPHVEHLADAILKALDADAGDASMKK